MAGMEGKVKCGSREKNLSQKLAGKLKGFALQLNVHKYKKKWEKKYNPTVEETQSGGIGEMNENGSFWLQPFDVTINKSLWVILR